MRPLYGDQVTPFYRKYKDKTKEKELGIVVTFEIKNMQVKILT